MPEALRIALLTHSVNPRGGVVHTLELAAALHAAGHAVTVFAPAAPGQRLFRDVPFAVELVPVGAPPADVAEMVEARITGFQRHLAPRLARQRFDVLHAQDPIGANALANLQARGLVDSFVRTVHHLDHFDDARLAAWQQRGFTAARQVFCVSRVWCEWLRQRHGIDAALVPNGVDLARFASTARPCDAQVAQRLGLRGGAARGEPVLLSVGGVEERKNSVRILQAFIALRRRHPAAQLVIAGGASLLDHGAFAAGFRREAAAAGLETGPGAPLLLTGPLDDAAMPALFRRADVLVMASLREGFGLAAGFRREAAAAGLETGPGAPLLLTGPLDDAAMPALFRRADVLVMASLREGFGLVVLEALACGTPVVASAIAPFTEYLGDADCCWADPLQPASIADAMQRALAPERAAALAHATPAVCLRFGWAASAARHLHLYRRQRPPPAHRSHPEVARCP